jgi:hypothetical protein
MNETSDMRSTALLMAVALPGLALGATCMIAAGAFEPDGFVERFQTLIASMVAIAAAMIGGRYVVKQINASDRQEQRRIERQLRAAQAVSTLSLSQLNSYCKGCVRSLISAYRHRRGGLFPAGVSLPGFPPVPRELVDDLRSIVENSPPEVSKAAARLLADLQIQHSRMNHIQERLADARAVVVPEDILELGIFTASIAAGGDRFIVYCRNLADDVGGLSWHGMFSALNVIGWDVDDFPEIHKKAHERFGHL